MLTSACSANNIFAQSSPFTTDLQLGWLAKREENVHAELLCEKVVKRFKLNLGSGPRFYSLCTVFSSQRSEDRANEALNIQMKMWIAL